jgi:dTDP-4-amino-4,6-dideoxygalactose transaminase
MPKILLTDLHRQYDNIKNQIDQAIAQVVEKKAFIRGPFVEQFEDHFAKAIQMPYCVGVGNGTDGLYIALKMLGIGSGDEVITAANSFIATSEAITMTGARVVFADCDDFYTIDPEDIKKKLTPSTKAIVPVHLYGQMADMECIMQIASDHRLFVVEDAAQAVLAGLNGLPPGRFGQFATFSFFPGKNLGAYGDAGALTSTDDALFQKAKMFANHGRTNKYEHEFEGINSRMDGIQGAILDVKLQYLEEWTKRRQEIATEYTQRMKDIKQITTPPVRTGAEHVFHIYAIRVDAAHRNGLLKYLNDAGIGAGIHYPVALPHLQAYQYLGYKVGDCPKATRFSKELISLPIFPEMTLDEVQFIVDKVNGYF